MENKIRFPMWKITKSKDDWNCMNCKKKILNGNYTFGKGWAKICIDCLPEFLNNQENKFKKGLERVKELKQQLENNKQKYKDTETINQLKRNQ